MAMLIFEIQSSFELHIHLTFALICLHFSYYSYKAYLEFGFIDIFISREVLKLNSFYSFSVFVCPLIYENFQKELLSTMSLWIQ